jgi:proline racemase
VNGVAPREQQVMRFERLVSVVDSHTAGEPTRVVLGGTPNLPGSTLAQKNDALCSRLDEFRGLLTNEPRGHPATHAVLPMPAFDERADISFLIISALGSLAMCGHALIGAVTTLIDVGVLPRREPTTTLTVETLAGLIGVEAAVRGGRVTQVTFTNAPAWVLATDVRLIVPQVGPLDLSVVYGGLWYAVVEVAQLGLAISSRHVARLVALSHQIRGELNGRLPDLLDSPYAPASIPQVLYIGPAEAPDADGRNLATSSELGFDRSPCGTGSSARMALHHARGELELGQRFVHESVLGSRFEGCLVKEVTIESGTAVLPSITGNAFVTGFGQLVVDPDDPLRAGFLIPPAAG